MSPQDEGSEPADTSKSILRLIIEYRLETLLPILLERDANPNQVSRLHPMLIAATSTPTIVQLLLDAGADINAEWKQRTALMAALDKNSDIALLLLQSGADFSPKNNVDPFVLAVDKMLTAPIDCMLDRGVDISKYTELYNKVIHTRSGKLVNAFMTANISPQFFRSSSSVVDIANKCSPQTLRAIIDSGAAMPNSLNLFDIKTPHDDPNNVCLENLKLLLDHGVSAEPVNPYERSTLIGAIAARNLPVIKLLLQHGACPNNSRVKEPSQTTQWGIGMYSTNPYDSSVNNSNELVSVTVNEISRQHPMNYAFTMIPSQPSDLQICTILAQHGGKFFLKQHSSLFSTALANGPEWFDFLLDHGYYESWIIQDLAGITNMKKIPDPSDRLVRILIKSKSIPQTPAFAIRLHHIELMQTQIRNHMRIGSFNSSTLHGHREFARLLCDNLPKHVPLETLIEFGFCDLLKQQESHFNKDIFMFAVRYNQAEVVKLFLELKLNPLDYDYENNELQIEVARLFIDSFLAQLEKVANHSACFKVLYVFAKFRTDSEFVQLMSAFQKCHTFYDVFGFFLKRPMFERQFDIALATYEETISARRALSIIAYLKLPNVHTFNKDSEWRAVISLNQQIEQKTLSYPAVLYFDDDDVASTLALWKYFYDIPYRGKSILAHAIERQNVSAVRTLVQNGIDPQIQFPTEESSPLELATKVGNQAIVTLLEEGIVELFCGE